MSAVTATEGAKVRHDLLHKGSSVDRGTDMQWGLFTNSSAIGTLKGLALAAITEPTGGGYARTTLTDASWNNTVADHSTYATQTFTASGTVTGTIYGWFIATTGTTPRLMYIGKFDALPSGINMILNDALSYTPDVLA